MKRTRNPAGIWCQVAGKIAPDETASAAALRELQEETGLTPTALYSADICEQFYEPGTDEVVIAPVFVAYVDPSARVQLNAEHSEFAWLSMAEAIDRVSFAGQRRMLRDVQQGFVMSEPSPLL